MNEIFSFFTSNDAESIINAIRILKHNFIIYSSKDENNMPAKRFVDEIISSIITKSIIVSKIEWERIKYIFGIFLYALNPSLDSLSLERPEFHYYPYYSIWSVTQSKLKSGLNPDIDANLIYQWIHIYIEKEFIRFIMHIPVIFRDNISFLDISSGFETMFNVIEQGITPLSVEKAHFVLTIINCIQHNKKKGLIPSDKYANIHKIVIKIIENKPICINILEKAHIHLIAKNDRIDLLNSIANRMRICDKVFNMILQNQKCDNEFFNVIEHQLPYIIEDGFSFFKDQAIIVKSLFFQNIGMVFGFLTPILESEANILKSYCPGEFKDFLAQSCVSFYQQDLKLSKFGENKLKKEISEILITISPSLIDNSKCSDFYNNLFSFISCLFDQDKELNDQIRDRLSIDIFVIVLPSLLRMVFHFFMYFSISFSIPLSIEFKLCNLPLKLLSCINDKVNSNGSNQILTDILSREIIYSSKEGYHSVLSSKWISDLFEMNNCLAISIKKSLLREAIKVYSICIPNHNIKQIHNEMQTILYIHHLFSLENAIMGELTVLILEYVSIVIMFYGRIMPNLLLIDDILVIEFLADIYKSISKNGFLSIIEYIKDSIIFKMKNLTTLFIGFVFQIIPSDCVISLINDNPEILVYYRNSLLYKKFMQYSYNNLEHFTIGKSKDFLFFEQEFILWMSTFSIKLENDEMFKICKSSIFYGCSVNNLLSKLNLFIEGMAFTDCNNYSNEVLFGICRYLYNQSHEKIVLYSSYLIILNRSLIRLMNNNPINTHISEFFNLFSQQYVQIHYETGFSQYIYCLLIASSEDFNDFRCSESIIHYYFQLGISCGLEISDYDYMNQANLSFGNNTNFFAILLFFLNHHYHNIDAERFCVLFNCVYSTINLSNPFLKIFSESVLMFLSSQSSINISNVVPLTIVPFFQTLNSSMFVIIIAIIDSVLTNGNCFSEDFFLQKMIQTLSISVDPHNFYSLKHNIAISPTVLKFIYEILIIKGNKVANNSLSSISKVTCDHLVYFYSAFFEIVIKEKNFFENNDSSYLLNTLFRQQIVLDRSEMIILYQIFRAILDIYVQLFNNGTDIENQMGSFYSIIEFLSSQSNKSCSAYNLIADLCIPFLSLRFEQFIVICYELDMWKEYSRVIEFTVNLNSAQYVSLTILSFLRNHTNIIDPFIKFMINIGLYKNSAGFKDTIDQIINVLISDSRLSVFLFNQNPPVIELLIDRNLLTVFPDPIMFYISTPGIRVDKIFLKYFKKGIGYLHNTDIINFLEKFYLSSISFSRIEEFEMIIICLKALKCIDEPSFHHYFKITLDHAKENSHLMIHIQSCISDLIPFVNINSFVDCIISMIQKDEQCSIDALNLTLNAGDFLFNYSNRLESLLVEFMKRDIVFYYPVRKQFLSLFGKFKTVFHNPSIELIDSIYSIVTVRCLIDPFYIGFLLDMVMMNINIIRFLPFSIQYLIESLERNNSQNDYYYNVACLIYLHNLEYFHGSEIHGFIYGFLSKFFEYVQIQGKHSYLFQSSSLIYNMYELIIISDFQLINLPSICFKNICNPFWRVFSFAVVMPVIDKEEMIDSFKSIVETSYGRLLLTKLLDNRSLFGLLFPNGIFCIDQKIVLIPKELHEIFLISYCKHDLKRALVNIEAYFEHLLEISTIVDVFKMNIILFNVFDSSKESDKIEVYFLLYKVLKDSRKVFPDFVEKLFDRVIQIQHIPIIWNHFIYSIPMTVLDIQCQINVNSRLLLNIEIWEKNIPLLLLLLYCDGKISNRKEIINYCGLNNQLKEQRLMIILKNLPPKYWRDEFLPYILLLLIDKGNFSDILMEISIYNFFIIIFMMEIVIQDLSLSNLYQDVKLVFYDLLQYKKSGNYLIGIKLFSKLLINSTNIEVHFDSLSELSFSDLSHFSFNNQKVIKALTPPHYLNDYFFSFVNQRLISKEKYLLVEHFMYGIDSSENKNVNEEIESVLIQSLYNFKNNFLFFSHKQSYECDNNNAFNTRCNNLSDFPRNLVYDILINPFYFRNTLELFENVSLFQFSSHCVSKKELHNCPMLSKEEYSSLFGNESQRLKLPMIVSQFFGYDSQYKSSFEIEVSIKQIELVMKTSMEKNDQNMYCWCIVLYYLHMYTNQIDIFDTLLWCLSFLFHKLQEIIPNMVFDLVSKTVLLILLQYDVNNDLIMNKFLYELKSINNTISKYFLPYIPIMKRFGRNKIASELFSIISTNHSKVFIPMTMRYTLIEDRAIKNIMDQFSYLFSVFEDINNLSMIKEHIRNLNNDISLIQKSSSDIFHVLNTKFYKIDTGIMMFSKDLQRTYFLKNNQNESLGFELDPMISCFNIALKSSRSTLFRSMIFPYKKNFVSDTITITVFFGHFVPLENNFNQPHYSKEIEIKAKQSLSRSISVNMLFHKFLNMVPLSSFVSVDHFFAGFAFSRFCEELQEQNVFLNSKYQEIIGPNASGLIFISLAASLNAYTENSELLKSVMDVCCNFTKSDHQIPKCIKSVVSYRHDILRNLNAISKVGNNSMCINLDYFEKIDNAICVSNSEMIKWF